MIFHNYGLDLETVQKIYEKQKNSPPMFRNAPPVAGNIVWARHLLRRIEDPMRNFKANKNIMATKDSKKIIKSYNRVARALIEFETLWHQAWSKTIEAAKAGLQATLVIRHPKRPGRLAVNFDPEIMQLIRESKCLQRIGTAVPDSAKMVLLQHDKFRERSDHLRFLVREYDRIVARISPVMRTMIRPHIEAVERKMQPGMVFLTWQSMNVDRYVDTVRHTLLRFEELVEKISDLITNRIEGNIEIIAHTRLVNIPKDHSYTLEQFAAVQERMVSKKEKVMDSKNFEVECAVNDLVQLVREYDLESDDLKVDGMEVLARCIFVPTATPTASLLCGCAAPPTVALLHFGFVWCTDRLSCYVTTTSSRCSLRSSRQPSTHSIT